MCETWKVVVIVQVSDQVVRCAQAPGKPKRKRTRLWMLGERTGIGPQALVGAELLLGGFQGAGPPGGAGG